MGGLAFLIPACKVLTKVLIYNTCFACIDLVFSTRILDDSRKHFSSEFMFNNLIICCTS